MILDRESMAFLEEGVRQACVVEVYSGEDIVAWHGNIERQLDRMLTTYTAARNQPYVDKLSAFISIWRNHRLTGSINVEDVESLLTATEVPAVDNWNLKNYFSNLRDRLRQLKASEEELPRMGPDSSGIGGMGGGFPGGKPSQKTLGQEVPSEYGGEADKLEEPTEDELPTVEQDKAKKDLKQ